MRFKTERGAVLFTFFVLSSLFSDHVMAQEMIRVAIFQNMKALNLKSDGGLTIHRSHGDLLLPKPVNDLRIVHSDSGLFINLQSFSESAIRVGSSRGDIRINGQ